MFSFKFVIQIFSYFQKKNEQNSPFFVFKLTKFFPTNSIQMGDMAQPPHIRKQEMVSMF